MSSNEVEAAEPGAAADRRPITAFRVISSLLGRRLLSLVVRRKKGRSRRVWRESIQRLTAECEFAPPASAGQLAVAEAALGVAIPTDLRALLSESNGVVGQYGLGLVWPVERIASDNLAFRSNADYRELYMPFDPLLFFANAGNGDQFAFSVQIGEVRRPDVFAWNHEDDSRIWVAPSLEWYLEWWLTGKIKL